MSSREPGKLSLTATLLFGAGALCLVGGSVTLADDLAVRGWSSVAGRVLSSEVTSETSSRTHAASGRSVTRTRYRADVEYEYSVDGTQFVGTRVSRANVDHLAEDPAAAIVARYPPGGRIDVYYDPDDASTAVLNNEVAGTGFSGLGLGALFVLAAVGLKIGSRF